MKTPATVDNPIKNITESKIQLNPALFAGLLWVFFGDKACASWPAEFSSWLKFISCGQILCVSTVVFDGVSAAPSAGGGRGSFGNWAECLTAKTLCPVKQAKIAKTKIIFL